VAFLVSHTLFAVVKTGFIVSRHCLFVFNVSGIITGWLCIIKAKLPTAMHCVQITKDASHLQV